MLHSASHRFLMNRDRSGCRLVLAAFCVSPSSCGASSSPPSVRAAREPSCPPVPVRAPSDRVCPVRRQNAYNRLKSMGNTLSYISEDPANEGPGINLQMLKKMIMPPPDESQRARSAASTPDRYEQRTTYNDALLHDRRA